MSATLEECTMFALVDVFQHFPHGFIVATNIQAFHDPVVASPKEYGLQSLVAGNVDIYPTLARATQEDMVALA